MPRKRDETINYIEQHKPFFSEKEEKTEVGSFEKGNVIRFVYDGKERHVFVVHPMWEGLVHGLDLKRIRRREFLIVANAPVDLTEYQLYEQFIKARSQVKDADAYRCYNPQKMTGLRTIVYDSTLQPGEESEQHIEEPEKAQEIGIDFPELNPLKAFVDERTQLTKDLEETLRAMRKKEIGE